MRLIIYFLLSCRCMKEKKKNKIASDKRLRGLTLKFPIAKKRKEGANIHIQYNDDGDIVGEREEKHETISEKRF